MSTIRTMEARMPPGFRFHPRDDELVLDYLLPKLSGHCHARGGVAMADVDVNKCEPWDLPEECCVSEGNEWYFFSLPDRKYTTGERTNRATRSGYWKATGKDRAVVAADDKTVKTPATLVGRRKTLVFYTGRAPNGRKTAWVMHEFRVELPSPPRLGREVHFPAAARHQRDHFVKGNWALCRVLYKSGTTTPRPASEDQAGMPTSYEPDLPVPAPPVIADFNAIDGSRTAAEPVSCFSGLPALPFRRPVSRGDGHAMDIYEKQAMGIMVSSMASTISSGLELAPNWEQENDMAQLWNRLYC